MLLTINLFTYVLVVAVINAMQSKASKCIGHKALRISTDYESQALSTINKSLGFLEL